MRTPTPPPGTKGLHPVDRARRRPRSDLSRCADAVAKRFPEGSLLGRHESAYNAGQKLAMDVLTAFAMVNADDTPWPPDRGPDPSWSYARGFVDVLLPAFEETYRLMGSKTGKRFARHLRRGLLNDLRYQTEQALEVARTTPPQFSPYSEEW